METKQSSVKFSDDKLQDLIKNVTNCKLQYFNHKEECKRLQEVNTKLEVELKEALELEKSHRLHLLTAREMIGNLQETVSQLLYLKRDVKQLHNEIISKDATISVLEKEKEQILLQQNDTITDLGNKNNKQIEELTLIYDRKVQQIQYDSETQIAQCNCVIEELRGKIKEMDIEHKDKINIIVLEYEEKVQRSAAQMAQLQEQLSRQTSRTDANIDAYRRKLEDLEEKLKQSQFKEYLAQTSYPSQYERSNERVERPYSVTKDYTDLPKDTQIQSPTQSSQTPSYKQKQKPLQVMYTENKSWNMPKNDKKGHFNITKKRKLYNEKEFLNN